MDCYSLSQLVYLAPQNALVTHSLMFTFDTYTQIGRAGESGMLNKNPNTGKLNFWFPHCQGNCIFSENYKSKYIEVVKLGAPLIN